MSKHRSQTWEQYLRRTRLNYSPLTDAVFGQRPPVPATPLRWAGQDRLLYGDRIINGRYTGNLLGNLTLPILQQLLSQATQPADIKALDEHIKRIQGPQPGAPADHLLLHSEAGVRATESSHSIVPNATCGISAASATSTKG